MKKFFGFALADSMFPGDCEIVRRTISIEEAKAAIAQGVESCCNLSHQATIDAMRSRFGIDVVIPEAPPRVALGSGDSVIVMGVRGLPRLTDRHEYTADEVAKATFVFTEYSVKPRMNDIQRLIMESYLRNTLCEIASAFGGKGLREISPEAKKKIKEIVFNNTLPEYGPSMAAREDINI